MNDVDFWKRQLRDWIRVQQAIQMASDREAAEFNQLLKLLGIEPSSGDFIAAEIKRRLADAVMVEDTSLESNERTDS